MASADIGGLGAKKGAPVMYAYTIPNLMPQLIPWVFVLLLLGLKHNRTGQAWWIWLPLLCLLGVQFGMQTFLTMVPSEACEMFCQMVDGIGFGLAGVWLLAPLLTRKHRFTTFLSILLSSAIISLLAYVVRQDWGESQSHDMISMFAMYIAIFNAALIIALCLTAFSCRRVYTPLRFLLWLSLWLVMAFGLICSVIILMVWLSSNQAPPWAEMLVTTLISAFISLALFLPFLLLLFANPFYRYRLKALLRLGEFALPRQEAGPPVIPSPDSAQATPPA